MTDRSRLDARYGRTPMSKRARITAWSASLGGLLVLVLAWVLWANPFNVGDSVEAKDLGHTLVANGDVRVQFQLTAQPGRASACSIQAMDINFTVVGWRVVEYPASNDFVRTMTADVRTVKPAVSGLVAACWLL